MSVPTAEAYLSVADAARRLGIPAHTLQRLVRLGEVRALRLPRSRPKISAAELARLEREHFAPAEPPSPETNPCTRPQPTRPS
jgi:excisionase family DNA binding protein